MKNYQEPTLELIAFSTVDVLTLSNPDKGEEDLEWE